ncbi:hypothetical protein AB0C07_38440 [Actinoplanes missouriensis]|uniref:ABC transporter ATP-binding protein n=1 Tax=Actinoplanes missouriensis TaxID=1866 RepID=UPI0033FD6DD6
MVEQVAHRVAVLRHGRVVEQGVTAEVLRIPQHPYTRQLLAAVPIPDPVRQAARHAGGAR